MPRYLFLVLVLFASPSFGQENSQIIRFRWTVNDVQNIRNIDELVRTLNTKTGIEFSAKDFILVEDKPLSTSHFRMYSQAAAGIPVRSQAVRIWTKNNRLLQAEGWLSQPQAIQEQIRHQRQEGFSASQLDEFSYRQVFDLILPTVRRNQDDNVIQEITWSDGWSNGQVIRSVRAKGRKGHHIFNIKVSTRTILDTFYESFPDFGSRRKEFSVPVEVFPIYEETDKDHQMLPRAAAQLRYLKKKVLRTDRDLFESMRSRKYPESMLNPLLGLTEVGRAQGYWAMSWVKSEAQKLREVLSTSSNLRNTILEGRYVSVNLHPSAVQNLKGLNFTPAFSTEFRPDWKETEVNGEPAYEMIPTATYLGRPLVTPEEAMTRVARRLPDHDPASYLNDGFDELQVYFAVNQFMDSLHQMGFNDPELSTRPFHAFLYDTDVSMRDNAYYTDDTINFTTYSASAVNYARDNPTIWHELGHGVMDRMMGDHLVLADTGGLSEGMADFLAALVVADVSKGQAFPGSTDFRIINKTGFFLTNEVHDDGEAYGGTMKDLLDTAMLRFGMAGLKKVTDLTMEGMRLCRNHPGLTAKDWFDHLLIADEFGNPGVREAGELKDLLQAALRGRNFGDDLEKVASITLKNGDQVVTDKGPGSRRAPIAVTLGAEETTTHALSLKLKSSETYKFQYPLEVRVEFVSGPLQGAIRWEGQDRSPLRFAVTSEDQELAIPLTAYGTCDYSNREDGSCVDFAYVQVWGPSHAGPVAKKRFYLRVKTK